MIYRSIFAFMALTDKTKIKTYSKIRAWSFYIQSLLIFGGIILSVIVNVALGKTPNYVMTLCLIVVVIALIVIDFHFTRVIQYFVKYNLDEYLMLTQERGKAFVKEKEKVQKGDKPEGPEPPPDLEKGKRKKKDFDKIPSAR